MGRTGTPRFPKSARRIIERGYCFAVTLDAFAPYKSHVNGIAVVSDCEAVRRFVTFPARFGVRLEGLEDFTLFVHSPDDAFCRDQIGQDIKRSIQKPNRDGLFDIAPDGEDFTVCV